MQMLEFFYEQRPKKTKFLPRKVKLPSNPRILIYGPPYSGKRSLVLHELPIDEKTLVIDTKDLRFDAAKYNETIQSFIDDHNINQLIIFNYSPTLRIPECEKIYLSFSQNMKLEGFATLQLEPLDFEEFLLFDRSSDPKVAFNNYLRFGTLPAIVSASEKDRRYQELLRLLFPDVIELKAIKEISFFLSQTASPYFIYTRLKERTRISKDRFYAFFEEIQKEKILYTINKYNSLRSAPKLYFFDFTLKNRLHIQKEFPKIFENMVFWQIRNRPLFYLDPLGLYDENGTLTLAIPFGNEVRIEEKINRVLAKNKLVVKKIEVVSVATSFEYSHGGIAVEVVPFYEWALR